MKLVIDIPDDLYTKLSKSTEDWACCYVEGWQKTVAQVIRNGKPYEATQGDSISREALKKAITDRLVNVTYSSDYADGLQDGYLNTINEIDNAPAVESYISPEVLKQFAKYVAEYVRPQGEFTDLEQKVIADAINYLLGAELLEENGYTEEVINALKSVLQKIGAEEHL